MNQINIFTPNTVILLLNSVLIISLCVLTFGYLVLRIRYKYSLTTVVTYFASNVISFVIYFIVLHSLELSISRGCIREGGC